MTQRRTTPLKQINIEGHHCSTDVRLEKLGMVPFFQGLGKNDLSEINARFRANHFGNEESIYYLDEEASWLWVVVFGAVKLIQHTAEGKDILIDLLKPGEYFGTLPVLGDDRYTETAYTQSTSCILRAGTADFESILHSYPSVSVKMIQITSRRLKDAREKILRFTTASVEQRIISVLLTLAGKFGEQRKDGILIQIPVSRQDLAGMSGTSGETASRIMHRFREEGLIRSGRQWISIINYHELEARLQ